MTWAFIGCLLAFLAVAFGAFGAHALRTRRTTEQLAVFQTGVQYQIMHALALVGVGLLGRGSVTGSLGAVAGWLFVVGTVLFSGSLYLLVLTGIRRLGAITPLGGLCFLGGWLVLAMAILHP